MPTAWTHAVPALAMGTLLIPPQVPRAVFITGVALAVIPDLDVIGFSLNIGRGSLLSHRGFSHSLLFALVASCLAYAVIRRMFPEARSKSIWLYFLLSGLSHGLLDGLTNGGWGVAFFAPLDSARYFFPTQPVLVSPISLEGIFTAYGKAVLWNEFQWVWVPFMFLSTIGYVWRFRILTRPAVESLSSNARSDLPTTAA